MIRKSLFVLFIISGILLAQSIDETLQQIDALKKEIAQNENLVEEKIADLKRTNPLFAEQGMFESDAEYLGRMSRAMPQLDRLRKQYLDDLWQKMSILRGRMFETSDITVILGAKYDANNETWPIVIQHNAYQKESFERTINITKEIAASLYKNWDKVQKTGVLTVDVGDKIGLAKFRLFDPISGFEYKHEFRPMKHFNGGSHSVAFSPDGEFLATSNGVYSLETGEKVRNFGGNAFSPDGKFLATSNGVYSLETGEKVRNIGGNAFSPDGKFLGGKNGNSAYIYNLETGQEVKSFNAKGTVSSVAFSPDGKYLAYGSYDDKACIYNLETGLKYKCFKAGTDVNSVAFSPDGKFLALGTDDSRAYIYNLETGKKVKSYQLGKVYSVAFSPDGKYLAAGATDNYARIYNLETDQIEKSWSGVSTFNSVAFSPDGKYLAAADKNFAYIFRTMIQVEEEVLAQKAISRPPALSSSVSFSEPSGNQFLDALEKGKFTLTLTNSGQGPGKGVLAKITPERTENLNYNNTYIEEVPPGQSVSVDIPLEAYIGIADGDHTFRFDFEEINGFPPDPVELQFSTRAWLKPEMFIVDVGVEDGSGNGMIESGEMINLTVRIGNKGKGTAKSAYAKFYSGDNVYITETHSKTVKIGELPFNDYIDIPLEFFVNNKTKDDIPLYVDLTEETNLANVSKLRLPIKKSERARKIQRTVVAGIDQDYGELTLGADLSIDVEQNIPITVQKNENALAIVFGIENYRNVSPVTFAKRDATFMKEYFEKTLGIPADKIYYKTDDDVTKGEFDKIFSKSGWLDRRADKNTDIYIYYAGHGAPEIKENKAYLIPYDGDPNYPSLTGYALDVLYTNLENLKARSVTVFLDACFTGANRESEILLAGARPLFMEVNPSAAGNITIFSAASGKEISSAWPEKRHGLFSYFLMKGMGGDGDANNDGQLTMDELGSYIQKNVSRQAGFLDREQTPQLQTLDRNKVLVNY